MIHSVAEAKAPVPAVYRHILIPSGLDQRDRSAVLFGLELAAAYRSRVTLLHVITPPEPAVTPVAPAATAPAA